MYKQAKKHFLQAVKYKDDCYRWAIVKLEGWCEVGEDHGDWYDSTDLVADFDGSVARVGASAWFWYGFYLHLLQCLSETGNETMWKEYCIYAVNNKSSLIEKPKKIQFESFFKPRTKLSTPYTNQGYLQSFCFDQSALPQTKLLNSVLLTHRFTFPLPSLQ